MYDEVFSDCMTGLLKMNSKMSFDDRLTEVQLDCTTAFASVMCGMWPEKTARGNLGRRGLVVDAVLQGVWP